MIYSLFIVIFKASMCCTFIMVYLILTNKFLLKPNQNYKYFAYNFCTRETNKKEIYRYRPKWFEKISAYRLSAKIQYCASLLMTGFVLTNGCRLLILKALTVLSFSGSKQKESWFSFGLRQTVVLVDLRKMVLCGFCEGKARPPFSVELWWTGLCLASISSVCKCRSVLWASQSGQ